MDVMNLEWEEIQQTYYQGSVNQFILFFIFQEGVDDFLLETTLPLNRKKYSFTSVRSCKKQADKLIRGFVLSCLK